MSASPILTSNIVLKLVSPCRNCTTAQQKDGCYLNCAELAEFKGYLAAYQSFTLRSFDRIPSE